MKTRKSDLVHGLFRLEKKVGITAFVVFLAFIAVVVTTEWSSEVRRSDIIEDVPLSPDTVKRWKTGLVTGEFLARNTYPRACESAVKICFESNGRLVHQGWTIDGRENRLRHMFSCEPGSSVLECPDPIWVGR